ncbi:hypothetical protein HNR46_003446 [Haloferula luteola]|uniref:alpha-L-rhamnosidase n=1 Tax=Haloferula luteola TaxID=595692 RepID=A0A840V5E5_9BACT|nr:glycoside hydrolase family 78 protein [Haloferula luteola]MBB5353192.1 hypothetical protein [Haloferula luteola]
MSRILRLFSPILSASVVSFGPLLAFEVTHLRCEYLTDPLGIETPEPRLSWLLDSSERGESQTAWQILVASSEEALASDQGDLWDSGKVMEDRTSQIVYGGAALGSRQVCHWKVRAWDKDGEPSEWSEPGIWSVGLLDASDWTATWLEGSLLGSPAGEATERTIVSATYGNLAGTVVVDVTASLVDMLAQGSFALPVTNDAFGGDPAYNQVKQLKIEYQLPGSAEVYTKTFAEDTLIVLPDALPALLEPVITEASWEAVDGSGSRDVLSVLQDLDQGSPYSVLVDNTAFGPDPAFNHLKQLRIGYTIDGVAAQAIIAENTTFNFPIDLPAPIEATLTSATYAAINGSGSSDVLALLQALGEGFSITVDNDHLGGDPAENSVKWLKVGYTRNGQNYTRIFEEDEVFEFPGGLERPSTLPYLRKSFTPSQPVARATVYATALGIYELSLNGQRIGDHKFAPEWTAYSQRLNYQTYDVTPLLQDGVNVVGAQLANGWYSGHIGNGNYQHWGVGNALRMQMEIEYADGSVETIATDGSWKSHASPILYSDIMQGEVHDARLEVDGWNTVAVDAADWPGVVLRTPVDVPISGQVMEPSREVDVLEPIELTEPAPGKWTFNLGQNMVGVLRIHLNEPAGTTVTLRHGERLNPDGTLYTANLRGAACVDTYVCRGGGETWQPTFTFHGFQYAEVTGLTTTPDTSLIEGIVIASDTPDAGSLATSDGRVNQLQSNIEWGQKGNYLSVPTDCPQRDERLGWLGDAQVFVRTATHNADIAAFFNKWMRDIRDSQYSSGSLPDVAPDAAPSSGTAGWSEAAVICPWTIYQAYGDTRILEENWDLMTGWMTYCKSTTSRGIRSGNRGSDYGDWLSINADTNREVIGTAYYAYTNHLMAMAATVLGKTAEAEAYQAEFELSKRAFNSKYVSSTNGSITSNTQCAYLLALKFDLLDEELRPVVANRLVADIHAKGDHLSTGFLGVSYLLPVLSATGHNDVAYTLLEQDTFPSWLFSISHGATTIWERWDGWTPENGFQSTIMNSFNHYSLGSCGEWLYETLAGISFDPSVPAYKKIVIHPQPGGTITHAHATRQTIQGEIASSWRLYDGGFTLETTIPVNTTAEVYVPAASAEEVQESGKPVEESEGVSFLRLEDGFAVFAVGSGRYRFTAGEGIDPTLESIQHDAGAPVKVLISTLLEGLPEGTRLLEFDTLSVNGAAVTEEDGWLTYTPSSGSVPPDSFGYLIRGADGSVETRTLLVMEIPEDAPDQTTLRFEQVEGGARKVFFSGVPGRLYRIEASDSLGAWETVSTVQADSEGSFTYTDNTPAPASRFYRSVFP